ncbi:MAG: glycosyltransferase [Nitrospirota bacterium]|nr:glycosyltransferase [Nitrospirota bacterium]MDE3241907.1 glycosyltransferase [Nitrospirota bacterium]
MKPLRLAYIGPAHSVTTRRWAEWFVRRGHEVTILTVEPTDASLPVGFRQIDLSSVSGPRKLGRLFSVAKLALQLRRLRPDLIHIHYARGLAWGQLLAGVAPSVVTLWGSDVLEEQGAFKEWYSRPLTKALLRKACLVTVHSAFMEVRVQPLLDRSSVTARIGWGVDVARFRPGLDVTPLRDRWQIPEDRRVLFSPRSAQPFYNLDRIIQALPLVRRRVPRALLVLAESLPDRAYVERLRRLVDDLGVREQVRFVGAIPYRDMPLWLNLAEVSVMVPQSDGMPNSLWEAMACGAIPLLNRLPQYAELIRDGEHGYFTDPEPEPLAEALARALADPAERERMARRNRAVALESGNQDREMARMEGWYATLLAGRGAGWAPTGNVGERDAVPCAELPESST